MERRDSDATLEGEEADVEEQLGERLPLDQPKHKRSADDSTNDDSGRAGKSEPEDIGDLREDHGMPVAS